MKTHKERILQLAVLLLTLFGFWLLMDLGEPTPEFPDVSEQKILLNGAALDEAATLDVFASDVKFARTRPVWLRMQLEKASPRSASLELPPISVCAPPMLLPIPTPSLRATKSLPRWPRFIKNINNP